MREMIRTCKRIYIENKECLLFVLGLFVVSMIALPYALLGEGSYVQIHDQLDGEVLNYIYQAKYLLGGDHIPEFMNGMSKASMLPPAPFGVLFYKILPPFAAFAVMHWICLLIGFVGMYLLCKRLGLQTEVRFVTACIFCYIPFYPVYGLAALGQPLLIYSFLQLLDGKKKLIPLLGIGCYAGMSSLTLIGYVWVVLGTCCTAGLLLLKRRKNALRAGMGTVLLTGVYLITNLDLLKSIFGYGFTTHRTEMVLNATEDLWTKGKELLFTGGSYSPVYSAAILIAGVLFLGVGIVSVWKKCCTEQLHRCMKAVAGLMGALILGVLLAVLWNCRLIVNIRTAVGGMISYFQADRIYWAFPFVWMLIMAWVLEGWLEWGKTHTRLRKENVTGEPLPIKIRAIIAGSICLVLVMAEGVQVLRDNTLNKNARLLLQDNYRQTTWESIYMTDVFEEVDEAIGGDKEKYSVVSLGIYPSVALYNGYTCADGYSNNYDLEYKHAFRRIIDKELEKSPEAKSYFDDWGNRLYLTAKPYGINGMVAKGQQTGYEMAEFDVAAMKELNIGYLFSAAPITFSEETAGNFELTKGSPFSDENSYYEIWVYKIR